MTADTNPAIDDDLNTTAPQSKPAEWRMPEPVYRRTSGRLPKGYEKQFPIGSTGEYENSAPSHDSVQAYIEPKPKNATMKIVVVLLAIVAMVAFIIAFLSILYFFFWRSTE